MPFSDLLNDRVSLINRDGRRFDDLPASVQSGKIFTNDPRIPIEDGDCFERRTPSGVIERFQVIDAGFMQEFHGVAAHYQSQVQKETVSALPPPREVASGGVASDAGLAPADGWHSKSLRSRH